MSKNSNKISIVWVLNGAGLACEGMSGGDMRLHVISTRLNRFNVDVYEQRPKAFEQILLTTPGGKKIFLTAGNPLPTQILPASLLLKREPFKAFRFYSYIITSIAAMLKKKKLPQGDVVISVTCYFCDVIPAILIKRQNPTTKLIVQLHHRYLHPRERPGSKIVNSIMYSSQTWAYKKIARFADLAWTLDTDMGDRIADEMRQLGMSADQIVRFKNGIDYESIRAVNDAGVVTKKVDAVLIGVRPNKGMWDIVPVWREVQKTRPGTTLRLMGGMGEVEALESEIKKAGLEEIITLLKPDGGYMDTVSFYTAIAEARIMFMPSHEEGWGIAVGEAMALGLPVVAYDLPVYDRTFGDAMVKLPLGEHKIFAEELCKMLDDSVAYQDYKNRGLECAKQYDWDVIAEEDGALLYKLLNGGTTL